MFCKMGTMNDLYEKIQRVLVSFPYGNKLFHFFT